jgi:hypothetical protein
VNAIRSDKGETDHTNIARSFLRLTNLDSHVFARLGRYETGLRRQTIQILLLLSSTEFRAKDNFVRPQFRRVRRRNGRYPAVWVRSVLEICGSVAIAMEDGRVEREA